MSNLPILLFAAGAVALPQIAFPFNAQVPPVAHVGQAYGFQLSPNTFTCDGSPLQFMLSNGPPWLHFEGTSERLSGTPADSDEGSSMFAVTATCSTGSVTMDGTVVVIDRPGPAIKRDVSEQLANAGKLSGPTSLSLYPSAEFQVQFLDDTFYSPASKLSYYATMADRSPIPSWLNFDGAKLSFSGTTPRLQVSSQQFDILLIASDVEGFESSSVMFSLVVSDHQFIFDPSKRTFNATKGAEVEITGLRKSLLLDGKQILDKDVSNVTAQLPGWLKIDLNTLVVSGTPPSGLMAQDFTVSARNRFGDVANTTIHLGLVSPLFSGAVGTLNVTVGREFRIPIRQSLIPVNVSYEVQFNPAQDWLKYDSKDRSICGEVPANVREQTIDATLVATSNDGSSTDTQSFKICVVQSSADQPSSTMTSCSPSGEATGATTLAESNKMDKSSPNRSVVFIAVGVSLALLFVAACALTAIYCRKPRSWWKKRKAPAKAQISRPITRPDDWQEPIEQVQDQDVEKAEGPSEKTPDRPPQIALELPVKAAPKQGKPRQSEASSLADREARILADFNRSSWGYDNAQKEHTPHESMKVPTQIARMSRHPELLSTRPRSRFSVYRDSTRRISGSAGLPVNRRLTGLGHGRPSLNCNSRSVGSVSMLQPNQHRECSSLSSYSTQATSMLSATPSVFPIPPAQRKPSILDKNKSIRIISPSAETTPDRRPLSERRQSYIRQRAINRSPFFGASGSIRTSSSSSRMGSRKVSSRLTAPPLSRRPRTLDENSVENLSRESFQKKSSKRIRSSVVFPADEISTSTLASPLPPAPNNLAPPIPPKHAGRLSRFSRFAEGYPRAISRSPSTILRSARSSRIFEATISATKRHSGAAANFAGRPPGTALSHSTSRDADDDANSDSEYETISDEVTSSGGDGSGRNNGDPTRGARSGSSLGRSNSRSKTPVTAIGTTTTVSTSSPSSSSSPFVLPPLNLSRSRPPRRSGAVRHSTQTIDELPSDLTSTPTLTTTPSAAPHPSPLRAHAPTPRSSTIPAAVAEELSFPIASADTDRAYEQQPASTPKAPGEAEAEGDAGPAPPSRESSSLHYALHENPQIEQLAVAVAVGGAARAGHEPAARVSAPAASPPSPSSRIAAQLRRLGVVRRVTGSGRGGSRGDGSGSRVAEAETARAPGDDEARAQPPPPLAPGVTAQRAAAIAARTPLGEKGANTTSPRPQQQHAAGLEAEAEADPPGWGVQTAAAGKTVSGAGTRTGKGKGRERASGRGKERERERASLVRGRGRRPVSVEGPGRRLASWRAEEGVASSDGERAFL